MTSNEPKYKLLRHMAVKRRSGFTLLEVMVALSIISVVLIAVFRLYAQTISMNHLLAFNTRAPFLAQQKMAQWTAMPADEMGDDSGGFGDDFPGYSWSVAVEDMALDSLASGNMKQIDVYISMQESGHRYFLRQYRFPRD